MSAFHHQAELLHVGDEGREYRFDPAFIDTGNACDR